MFGQRKKHPSRENSVLPLRRRTLLSPERLEARDLPGGCVYSAPLLSALTSSVSDLSSGSAYVASSSTAKSVGTKTDASASASLTAPSNDPLCLLSDTTSNAGPAANRSVPVAQKTAATTSTASGSVSVDVRSLLASSASTSVATQQTSFAADGSQGQANATPPLVP